MDYNIVTKEQPTFYFIGVTTGKSSINKVFPLWMDVMGRPEVVLEGIDHPASRPAREIPQLCCPDQV